jgi:hypothetical protein
VIIQSSRRLLPSGYQFSVRFTALMLSLIGISCTGPAEVVRRFSSPDGTKELVIWRIPHAPDWSVRITLGPQAGRQDTVYQDRDDRSPTYTDAVWLESQVGVLVCDGYSERLQLAFNTTTGAQVSSGPTEAALRQKTLDRFGLLYRKESTSGEGILEWICNEARRTPPRF